MVVVVVLPGVLELVVVVVVVVVLPGVLELVVVVVLLGVSEQQSHGLAVTHPWHWSLHGSTGAQQLAGLQHPSHTPTRSHAHCPPTQQHFQWH